LGKTFDVISHLGAKRSTGVVVQPDERDTEHSTTSSSNQEDLRKLKLEYLKFGFKCKKKD